jgi:hypothetical protein
MSAFLRNALLLIAAIAVISTSSCGRASKPRLAKVRGSVRFNGTPTPGATVFFYPANANAKAGSVRPHGVVQDDGSFEVSTFGRDDGAPAGDYEVTVVWAKPGRGDSDGDSLIPIDYGNPKTSQLRATVTEPSTDLPSFELQKGFGSSSGSSSRSPNLREDSR